MSLLVENGGNRWIGSSLSWNTEIGIFLVDDPKGTSGDLEEFWFMIWKKWEDLFKKQVKESSWKSDEVNDDDSDSYYS